VNPTIAAALISGGVGAFGILGAVITSAVGSRNTRKAMERTVETGAAANRATLITAREDRLHAARAAAYEAMLAKLLHRRQHRQFELRKVRFDRDVEHELARFFERYELPGMFETEGRLAAYASEAVMSAYRAASVADAQVTFEYGLPGGLGQSAERGQLSGRLEGVLDADTLLDAPRTLDAALHAADAADSALIEVIRAELRSRPEAAIPPAEGAVTRSRRQRRKEVQVLGAASKMARVPGPGSRVPGPGFRVGEERYRRFRSSRARSETGPRCPSLSGLTTERIACTWPSAISSANTLTTRPPAS
jgi:hypothetical protein